MINPKALLADLQKQVRELEKDLRQNEADIAKLRGEWQAARDAGRTAADFDATWLPERITQVAVAWVLATTFVRFCEDNGLIELPFIAGPGERTAQARERQDAFFLTEEHRGESDREWLHAAFDAMSVSPVAKGLFAEHNPMWEIKPSPSAAKALLDFWRKTDANGEIIHDFTDPEWNTRFLGNLYQDLSEAAQKSYALLQTPEFVEEFILKYTLDPAIEEFGLEPAPPYGHDDLPHRLRVIDPACGSGHFLLGAFQRLLKAWENERPAADRREVITEALASVHGVDKNPFAVAIARFRLLLAVMKVAEVTRLDEKVDFPLNIAVGDSLLYGRGAPGIQGQFEFEGERPAYTYNSEDIEDFIRSVNILDAGTYHVVVGNPPYITARDKRESDNYREAYLSCYKEYSLSVPFAERFFKLAIVGAEPGYNAGYVGQITANSFMKREFGQKLVREFFPLVDLTHVIDTSGAYIPEHGIPTVIIFGRRRRPASPIVRTVRSVKGEPRVPPDAAKAPVWQEIVHQVDNPGFDGEWISVGDLERGRYFERHPWILESGGLELVEFLEKTSAGVLSGAICRIGYYGDTHADEAFIRPLAGRLRNIAKDIYGRRFHRGQQIRNWCERTEEFAILPYDNQKVLIPQNLLSPAFMRLLWPLRTELWNRADFSGTTYRLAGKAWWKWHQLPADATGHPWVLAYADLVTHNHFTLNRSGDVYNRHAPIVRLVSGASAEDYLGLLAVLNSSTACYWLKRVSHDKGAQGINEGFKSQEWERFFEFTGAKLEKFPLSSKLPLEFGRELDSLAQRSTALEPSVVCADSAPTQDTLNAARATHERIRSRMIALQEELDWDVYHRYGVLTDQETAELVAAPESVPELKLGERAFEIVLARRMRDEGLETQWFERHHSKPITDVPVHWPDEYKAVVKRRIEVIHANRNIGLIERPECKRRWQSDPWEDKEKKKALTSWLLDRCEEQSLWFVDGQPQPMTVNRLADRLREDADVVSVARLLKGPDADLADVLAGITKDEHVPYLAQLRYKPQGIVKRRQWQRTWDLQREEDATGKRLDIPVPPKYKNTDFAKPSYWRNRGKLDVPKERFISYPNASPDSDKSLLLGWAGWDHLQQAQALIALIEERESTDGWTGVKLKPLIDGLAEVMPWVRQWHNEYDDAWGDSPADVCDTYLTDKRVRHGLSE